MKIKKQYLIPAILASAIVLMQNPLAFAGSKEVDEELSPYKWGHWDRMVPPAAGPVALAPAAVTAPLPDPPDPVPPPPPPPPPPTIDIPRTPAGSPQPGLPGGPGGLGDSPTGRDQPTTP